MGAVVRATAEELRLFEWDCSRHPRTCTLCPILSYAELLHAKRGEAVTPLRKHHFKADKRIIMITVVITCICVGAVDIIWNPPRKCANNTLEETVRYLARYLADPSPHRATT